MGWSFISLVLIKRIYDQLKEDLFDESLDSKVGNGSYRE